MQFTVRSQLDSLPNMFLAYVHKSDPSAIVAIFFKNLIRAYWKILFFRYRNENTLVNPDVIRNNTTLSRGKYLHITTFRTAV